MINTMLIANIIAWISCVVFFITTIVTKKRNVLRNIKIAYIGIFGYLLVSSIIYVSPIVNVGLGFITYLAGAALSLLLMVISLIISRIKWKKLSDQNEKKISRFLYLYFVPLALILVSIAVELFALHKADIVLIEYSGFLEPNEYYAINSQACQRLSINTSIRQGKEVELKDYVSEDHDGDFTLYILSDKETKNETIALSESQMEILRNIAAYDGLANKINLNGDSIEHVEIYMLEATDYYLATYYIKNENKTVHASAIFMHDKFVDNIDVWSPEEIIYYTK